jgi:hypothetical protein
MLDGTEMFECVCHSFDHNMRMTLDLDEQEEKGRRLPTIFIDVGMSQYLPWYKRVWVGLKYMIGYASTQYGSWEINYNNGDVDRMITMGEKLKIAIDSEHEFRKQNKK